MLFKSQIFNAATQCLVATRARQQQFPIQTLSPISDGTASFRARFDLEKTTDSRAAQVYLSSARADGKPFKMKISLVGISNLPLGKFNVKDPRLDQVHKLVEADKKSYVQADLVGEAEAASSDAILVASEARADLVLKDWEFVETRLSRTPPPGEEAVLTKLKTALEKEQFAFQAGLTADEQKIAAVYNLVTLRPVLAAEPAELAHPEELILKLLRESGYICFLTVGGKENRAWPIRAGTTAWEAASVIHSDLQKGFIRAEIISFEDFIQAGGETQAKRAGKMRLEQKNYVMRDCDITNFRVNK
jgi:hypothetical protein